MLRTLSCLKKGNSIFRCCDLYRHMTVERRNKMGKILEKMTLEQKAQLLTGFEGTTKEFEELGIPKVFMADGPHGARKPERKAVRKLCSGRPQGNGRDRRRTQNMVQRGNVCRLQIL